MTNKKKKINNKNKKLKNFFLKKMTNKNYTILF